MSDVQQVAVFGLGKVGLTLTGCLLSAGKTVVGVDVREDVVESVRNRAVATPEPGVLERITPAYDRLSATTDAAEAVRRTGAAFVIVPTGSNALGGFSNAHILESVTAIGKALRDVDHHYVISIVSTMMPGSSERQVIRALEESSGRKIGDGLGYCYNPSFIAQGEVVRGLEQPSYLLIGEADQRSGDCISALHLSMIKNGAPIARMTPTEAEIAKLASNTYETMRVTFANMLLSICSEVPNANVDNVTDALAHRMGKRFFRGAVPYGGPCWPRDNVALSKFMETVSIPSLLPRTIDLCNHEHGVFVLRRILHECPQGSSVGVVGLAYKPGTPMLDCAYSIDLCQKLNESGRRVSAWDPMAGDAARAALPDEISVVDSLEALAENCDSLVLTLPLKELADFDWSKAAGSKVIDCWRALMPDQIAKLETYLPLGVNTQSDWLSDNRQDQLFAQLTE